MKKRSIFNKRVNILPYDYPSLLQYKDAIRHSYWIDTEYNFTTDINDFMVNINDTEREAIKRTMLAIAQIEVNVKTFWADMYKRMPITEIGDVGMTFAECHVEGTEVLTPNGWVNFKNINVGDNVIQYNDDKTLSITKVNKVTNEPYKGKVIKFTKENLEAIVTPNHRFIVFNRKNEPIIKTAEELEINDDNLLPEAAKLIGGTINKLSWEEKLRIVLHLYYNANLKNNSNVYEIKIKNDYKKDRLREILSNLNFKYNEIIDSKNDEVITFKIDMDQTYGFETFDWVNLNDKTWEWCNEFVNELLIWYNRADNVDSTYATPVKSCFDKVQMVGVGAGYKCIVNKYKFLYTIQFIKNQETSNIGFKKEELNYDGNIYCISVDSGRIITKFNNNSLISCNSEVRHKDAYARLLRILGLEDEFKTVIEIPAIKDRIKYLTKYLDGTRSDDNKMYTKSILLFSLFIEHVSLFSQFLIMMSFNKEKNIFKGISNVVEATSKEEDIHGNFGAEIINIIKEENPEWFDEEFNSLIYSACKKAYKAECKIIDWIFENGELDFLSKETIRHFIMDRFNNSLNKIGMKPIFDVNINNLEKTLWFNVEISSTKEGDFFQKKSIDYSKKTKSITEDDLFD
jgi:ribonucleotide reductase beta subunit family protein with ferritin-like domain